VSWLKLDDSFAEHPKVAAVSDAAFRAHVTAMCYSARLLTDGRVPEAVARSFRPKVVKELIRGGLWAKEPTTGYLIHDYLDWNPSRAQVLERRRKESARKSARTPLGGPVSSQAEAAAYSPPDSVGPVPDPYPTQTAPSANANGNPNQPSGDQLYLLKRLFEHDSNWSSVTVPALVQLNKRFGRGTVHEAMQDLREAPPDQVRDSAYGLLQRTCEAKS
jgi:hypothetical protein